MLPKTAERKTPLHLWAVAALLAAVMAVLSACQTSVESAATAPAEAEAAATPAGAESSVLPMNPLAADQSAPPARLEIPDLNLDVDVVPMGWQIVTVDGERTTMWTPPEDQAGWHVNSAHAGALGNVLISGRQADGAAVFAPLALGSVSPGQEIWLTDQDGVTFVYQVSEVSEPVPITGATDEEIARAAAYQEQGDTARLTLITGWPDFTTTHRVFVVADFLGALQ